MRKFMDRIAVALRWKAAKIRQEVKEVVSELKNDERGLSGVVVAILLILVAVLAVVMIWGFLSGYLAEVWERITSADTI